MTTMNLLLCLLCLAAASPVLAEEPAIEAKPATEVRVDEEAGEIHFVIDGKTITTIDRNGLTIIGDVRYTGATHDISTPNQQSATEE